MNTLPILAAITTLTILSGVLLGCHRNCDSDRPVPVQVLAGASEVLNPNVDGTSWALNLWLVELKSAQGLVGLDAKEAIRAERAEEGSPFGEDYVKSHRRTIFPGEKKAWQIELDPTTTHVVTIGDFRQIVGEAWLNVYELPPNQAEQRCDAERKQKRRGLQQESAPCIYLYFDSHEVRGGRYRPAGLGRDGFGESMICMPVTDPKAEKRKERQQRKERREQRRRKRKELPSLQAPSTPSTPSTPSAPSAPSAPAKPGLPVPG